MKSIFTFAVVVFAAFSALPALAQTTVVTHEHLILKAADSDSFCGVRTEDQKTMCVPTDMSIAHARGTYDFSITTDIGTCGHNKTGDWQCWGATSSSSIDATQLHATASALVVASGRNICHATTNDLIVCSETNYWSEGDYQLSTTRYGPFRQIRSFAVSDDGLCVIDSEGVKCQQRNYADTIPTNVKFAHPRSIALSKTELCVLDDGGVRCWSQGSGRSIKAHADWAQAKVIRANTAGVCAVLGNGTLACDQPNPTANATVAPPKNLTGLSDLAMNEDTSCALLTSGAVRCWGSLSEPVPSTLKKATSISLADDHACATDASGDVICWGANDNGQLDQPLKAGATPLQYAFNSRVSCQWNDTGAFCRSSASGGPTEFETSALSHVLSMSLPTTYNADLCAVTTTAVTCQGSNASVSKVPPEVQNATLVASTEHDACAALQSGQIICWGESNIGNSPTNTRGIKKLVMMDKAAVCALDQFGLLCWGPEVDTTTNKPGRLKVPDQLNPDGAVIDVALTSQRACALDFQHVVTCWGDSTGTTVAPGLNTPIALFSYGSTMCATDDDGVKCWGGSDLLPGQKRPNRRTNSNSSRNIAP